MIFVVHVIDYFWSSLDLLIFLFPTVILFILVSAVRAFNMNV